MNVEMLTEIKARILAEPDAFRMDTWTCGTAHCIAGWALRLADMPVINAEAQPWLQLTTNGDEPGQAAADVLGLSMDYDGDDDDFDDNVSEAGRLFHVTHWPEDLQERYEDATSRSERAQVAAKRIDRFIATDGAE